MVTGTLTNIRSEVHIRIVMYGVGILIRFSPFLFQGKAAVIGGPGPSGQQPRASSIRLFCIIV